MISESQQEQASLYALGLLDADEAGAFEQQLGADPVLSEFVHDLQETAALLALVGDGKTAAVPPALRERVLAEIKADGMPIHVRGANTSVTVRPGWLPWAIAALVMACACSGAMWWLAQRQRSELVALRQEMDAYEQKLSSARTTAIPAATDPLAQVSFCALEPTPDFTNAQPRAAVLWDAAHRQGKLRVNRLAPPAQGKDYQLWAVEAGRKDSVSAGLVHVDADGKADLPFQPVTSDGKPVVAVAISLEQAGGSPTNQGPILLLGKF